MNNVKIKIGGTLLCWGLYIVLSYFVIKNSSGSAYSLTGIPIVLTAFFWGIWGGIISGVLVYPFHLVILEAMGIGDGVQIWIWLPSVIVFFCIGVLVGRLRDVTIKYRFEISLRYTIERALKEKETEAIRLANEKSLLLREMNHRIVNNLSILQNIIRLAMVKNSNQTKLNRVLDEMNLRISCLAETHKIIHSNKDSVVDVALLIEALSDSVIGGNGDGERIQYITEIQCPHISSKTGSKLALIINELLINSIKYAFRDSKSGYIEIRCQQKDRNIIELFYRDSGVGFPSDVLSLRRKGIGISLIETIITDELDGTISLYNDKGAVTVLTFSDVPNCGITDTTVPSLHIG